MSGNDFDSDEERIMSLQQLACEQGDSDVADLCQLALEGDEDAISNCLKILENRCM